MKPSPGIIPQAATIARLQEKNIDGKSSNSGSADPAPDVLADGSGVVNSAAVKTAEKTILAKLLDALRSVKP